MDRSRYLLSKARLSCVLKCLLLLFFCTFLKSHSSHSYLTFSLIVPLEQIVFYIYVRIQSVKFVMSQIVIKGLRLTAWPLPPRLALILVTLPLNSFLMLWLHWPLISQIEPCVLFWHGLDTCWSPWPGSSWVFIIASFAHPFPEPPQNLQDNSYLAFGSYFKYCFLLESFLNHRCQGKCPPQLIIAT